MRWTAVPLLLLSCSAWAIDDLEFQLYGLSGRGREVDIRPYNQDSFAKGKVDGAKGVYGDFYELVGREEEGQFRFVGSCRVQQRRIYTFSCAEGRGSFSGVAYEGRPRRKVGHDSEVRALSKPFIARFEHGEIAAVYRCVRGCGKEIPATLLLAWRGD